MHYIFLLFTFQQTPEACRKFEILGTPIGNGRVRGEIILIEPIDYEERSSYIMAVSAEVKYLLFLLLLLLNNLHLNKIKINQKNVYEQHNYFKCNVIMSQKQRKKNMAKPVKMKPVYNRILS